MGLIGSLLGAAIKVAVTPIAVVADVVSVVQGETPTNTVKVVESAYKDVKDSVNDIL